MLGIEGSGVRGLAFLLGRRGLTVVGSDDKITESQQIDGYTVVTEADTAARLATADLLIYSDAVKSDHPLRVAAQERGKRQLPYQEALGEFAKEFRVLAVTGTHGKSSTTAMLAHIAVEAGLDPSVLVGASIPQFAGRNARAGKGAYLIVEADEYRRHFLALSPAHIIITSIDFDHPDYFSGLPDVEAAYSELMNQMKEGGKVIVPAVVKAAHPIISWPGSTIEVSDEVACPLPGRHMRQNAALAVALAETLGITREDAIASLQSFQGLSRRMEKIGMIGKAELYSDYGHHPEEIAVTLTGAREKFAGKKIGIFVEPHMIERLTTFFEQFVAAVSQADEVVICPVFAPKGREGKDGDARDKFLAALHTKGVAAHIMPSFDDLPSTLKEVSARADIIIAFTAGVLDSKLRQVI